MKIVRFVVLFVMVMLLSNSTHLAYADKFSDAIETFKGSEVVKPFFKKGDFGMLLPNLLPCL